MKIKNEVVVTVGAGKNMEEKLVALANNKGFTEKNGVIFVGQVNFGDDDWKVYVESTHKALNVEDYESFKMYKNYEFVGYHGNSNTYLYK